MALGISGSNGRIGKRYRKIKITSIKANRINYEILKKQNKRFEKNK